jgi:predicted RNA-binding protein associated with RNAse of E/G family
MLINYRIIENKKDYKYLKKLEDTINYHDLYIKVDEIKNLN